MTLTEILGVVIVAWIAFGGIVLFVMLIAGRNADEREGGN